MIDKELLLLVLVKLAAKAGSYYRAAFKQDTTIPDGLTAMADGIIEAITEIVEKALFTDTTEEEYLEGTAQEENDDK